MLGLEAGALVLVARVGAGDLGRLALSGHRDRILSPGTERRLRRGGRPTGRSSRHRRSGGPSRRHSRSRQFRRRTSSITAVRAPASDMRFRRRAGTPLILAIRRFRGAGRLALAPAKPRGGRKRRVAGIGEQRGNGDGRYAGERTAFRGAGERRRVDLGRGRAAGARCGVVLSGALAGTRCWLR